MRTLNKLIILSCLWLIFSCNKEKFQPDFSNGQATALKNNQNWKGSARGGINNQGIGVDIVFSVFNDFGELRQELVFSKIPLIKGDYTLFIIDDGQSSDSISRCNFNTISHDGDVLEDRYDVDESSDERNLTVTSYDETTNILQGTFDVMLKIDTSRIKYNINNPETIHFSMGEFEVKIKD